MQNLLSFTQYVFAKNDWRMQQNKIKWCTEVWPSYKMWETPPSSINFQSVVTCRGSFQRRPFDTMVADLCCPGRDRNQAFCCKGSATTVMVNLIVIEYWLCSPIPSFFFVHSTWYKTSYFKDNQMLSTIVMCRFEHIYLFHTIVTYYTYIRIHTCHFVYFWSFWCRFSCLLLI